MHLLHFTQIALYAYATVYPMGKMWVFDKMLCSLDKIRRGGTSFYLFDLSWIIFQKCFRVYFSSDCCDDLVGDL